MDICSPTKLNCSLTWKAAVLFHFFEQNLIQVKTISGVVLNIAEQIFVMVVVVVALHLHDKTSCSTLMGNDLKTVI